jgi:hypothetical protein
MELYNRNSYKKKSLVAEFFNSCLGKIVILIAICLVLMVVALMSVPSDEKIMAEMNDNIRECIQDNDPIRGDAIDAFVDNINNIFTQADTLRNDKEVMIAYRKYNRLKIYHHALFSTAHILNNMKPEGVRVGIGIFGMVIPTVAFSDLLISAGPARGNYNERLINDAPLPDWDPGENPNINPYHYQGNPDD